MGQNNLPTNDATAAAAATFRGTPKNGMALIFIILPLSTSTSLDLEVDDDGQELFSG